MIYRLGTTWVCLNWQKQKQKTNRSDYKRSRFPSTLGDQKLSFYLLFSYCPTAPEALHKITGGPEVSLPRLRQKGDSIGVVGQVKTVFNSQVICTQLTHSFIHFLFYLCNSVSEKLPISSLLLFQTQLKHTTYRNLLYTSPLFFIHSKTFRYTPYVISSVDFYFRSSLLVTVIGRSSNVLKQLTKTHPERSSTPISFPKSQRKIKYIIRQ